MLRLENGDWGPDRRAPRDDAGQRAQAKADLEALSRNQVEIRTVERRQVFVGGRPVGDPID
jgi:hypothetical protein